MNLVFAAAVWALAPAFVVSFELFPSKRVLMVRAVLALIMLVFTVAGWMAQEPAAWLPLGLCLVFFPVKDKFFKYDLERSLWMHLIIYAFFIAMSYGMNHVAGFVWRVSQAEPTNVWWVWQTLAFTLILGSLTLGFSKRRRGTFLPPSPEGGFTPLYIIHGPVWSALNAIAEELFFRGALLTAGSALAHGNLWQALIFAAYHVCFGYRPIGVVGAFLTGVWAFWLGWLTLSTGSLIPAILFHLIADVFIYFWWGRMETRKNGATTSLFNW